ncbi:reverse transcriptase domain-containing protein, partial [Tanacetum coccineum]
MNERCSAVLLNKLSLKEKDPGSFTIPCDIGNLHIDKALADLGASISLMPYSMYEKLGLGEPNPTRMSLELTDRSIKYPRGIAENETHNFEKTWNEHLCSASANEINEKRPQLKDIPSHLEYAYLNGDRACPDVVKNEIVKLLDSGLIYPILDSLWVGPIHVVLKKGGMIVVLNDNNKPVPSRTVIRWHVCIDYRKLNDATRKDHFPLLFIDQMLERLFGNEFYCFLDGFSGFFQIPIAPRDQEKTTFTCPYRTFAYRRMSFGLCNAPATFQRCMNMIFHDMVEDFMEVFMDNFSVFGNSFNHYLGNLDKMLARCEETNLVLNWEKCHFMVNKGIVLGYKISGKGIEVDRAEIDVIAKLPYPTNVKGVRSFLGHTRDFAVGAVLGQRIDGKFKPIYYASKTLNDAQAHYTTTEKELLAVYLFSKQDAKPTLIRWVLLLQGFDIEIKDKKGAENMAADHLSMLENPNMGILTEIEIADGFPDEHLIVLKTTPDNDEP